MTFGFIANKCPNAKLNITAFYTLYVDDCACTPTTDLISMNYGKLIQRKQNTAILYKSSFAKWSKIIEEYSDLYLKVYLLLTSRIINIYYVIVVFNWLLVCLIVLSLNANYNI